MATEVATRQCHPDSSQALRRTSQPGVYKRGHRYVAVYRREGRQRKEAVATFTEARAIKLAREAEARAERLGPTLHDHALHWVASYAGIGDGPVSARTRSEYRRLLITFALRFFPAELRLRELDEALQNFIAWLLVYRGERGRLADQSIANAVVPLRLCLASAERDHLVEGEITAGLQLPRRREKRSLSMDLGLEDPPYLWVRRSIVKGVVGAPKSRFGIGRLPLEKRLAAKLRGRREPGEPEESLVFPSTTGTPLNPTTSAPPRPGAGRQARPASSPRAFMPSATPAPRC